MKSLLKACTPRKSVFDPQKRFDVLDLSNLLGDDIDGDEFFAENFVTDGMKVLFDTAFNRFAGHSDRGIIRLTQAMGGGKTHNMIALGLLARYPNLRKKVLGKTETTEKLGKVRVIGFTGRESDAPFGIWGSLAEQLGKREEFSSYYSPLAAPGPTAWINLLKGDPVLVLLDELPPYLENAKSKPIGNTDLSVVTTTALANLYVAIAKKELSNVCLVISDLRATYESGSDLLMSSFKELENETGRYSLDIEPVGANTDDVYQILKIRLFEKLPDDAEINEVAGEYKKALEEAVQMDLSSLDPDSLYVGIKETYPFHPSIRDLFARFKENPGFQQTRGLIRLMRVMVSQLYSDGGAGVKEKNLIHASDMDLNNREMMSAISQIKPSLSNAISHDIANGGKAAAEEIDKKSGGSPAQEIAKLLLVSSLANVPNAKLGLHISEAVGFLSEPGRDSRLLKKAFDDFTIRAWYLHADRDDNFFFQDTKNIVAQLNSLVDGYTNEIAKKELREFLNDKFRPSLGDCYQEVNVFPAVDEIKLTADRVLLVLAEPYTDDRLKPELLKFYEDATFKNRVLFLTGARSTMDSLYRAAKQFKGISQIMKTMKEEGISDKDTQFELAQDKEKRLLLELLSAARETFVTLYYPSAKSLLKADFLMQFQDNNYNGEEQIRQVLKEKYKFTEESSGDGFRQKVEQKLFTRQSMPLNEIKERAATDPSWLWYSTRAMDQLKDSMVQKDFWRESGGYVDKGPFAKESTDIQVMELRRDEDTGMTTLRLVPKHADTVYFDIDTPATPSSLKVDDVNNFQTHELKLSFLAVDSSGNHSTGKPREWKNRITLKYRIYDQGDKKMLELQSAPPAKIRYTTDGSDPKTSGGNYDGPVEIPKKTTMVLAIAEEKGIYSEKRHINVDKKGTGKLEIDPARPLEYRPLKRKKTTTTHDTYTALKLYKKHGAELSDLCITCNDEATQQWIEVSYSEKLKVSVEHIEAQIDSHRTAFMKDGKVSVSMHYAIVHFENGQCFLDWAAESKCDLGRDFDRQEIIQ
ncbi:MAG TPA: DUF499 domain-containing protein [Spirochaetota bacterium]|nr:DUF499 domain-containing protein [Spirochaetota bacterium]